MNNCFAMNVNINLALKALALVKEKSQTFLLEECLYSLFESVEDELLNCGEPLSDLEEDFIKYLNRFREYSRHFSNESDRRISKKFNPFRAEALAINLGPSIASENADENKQKEPVKVVREYEYF